MVKTAFFEEELDVPEGIKVNITEDHVITIQGPNGTIRKDFSHIRGVKITLDKNKIKFSTHFPQGTTLALAKTVINIINNLLIGAHTNYKYYCKICYSHFPFTAELKKNLGEVHFINFLGERAPRKTKYLNNVNVSIQGDDVILEGPDKETLGQTAANMKSCCKIRKKDPRVFQDGVYLYKIELGDEILWQIR